MHLCTDSIEESSSNSPLMSFAKDFIKHAGIPDAKWEPMGEEAVDSRIMMKHPGPIVNPKEMTVDEKQWQGVGSGIVARTFDQARRLATTTRGGPPIEDVHRRTRWSQSKGKVIDDCIVDDVAGGK